MKSVKFKRLIINSLVCASVLSLSACSSESTQVASVLNVHNTNELGSEMIATPWKNQSFATMLMYRTMFDTNLSTGDLTKNLIKSYFVSDDALTYTFEMKDDIIWSDGEEITAEDVVFSMKALLLTEQFNGIFQTAIGNIVGADEFMLKKDMNEDIEGLLIDGNVITITLKSPVHSMLNILGQFAILPEHCFVNSDIAKLHEDEYWKNPVISGMYMVDEIVANNYIKLVPNIKRTANTSKIDEIMIHANANSTFDLYATNNVDDILDYRANSEMVEYKIDSLFYRYFVFNIDKDGETDPVLNDQRFREAIAYAIDREILLKDVYYNIGDIFDSAYVTDVERNISYNQNKAKELLAEMEYDFERPVKLFYYYTDDTSKRFMKEVKVQLENVGLTVEIIEPNDISLFVFDDYDICLKGLSAFTENDWYLEYQSTNALNINLFGGDTRFDTLIEELAGVFKYEDELPILQELQKLEYETIYKIPLFTLGQRVYVNENRVALPENIEFGSFYYKYDWYFDEWEIKQ